LPEARTKNVASRCSTRCSSRLRRSSAKSAAGEGKPMPPVYSDREAERRLALTAFRASSRSLSAIRPASCSQGVTVLWAEGELPASWGSILGRRNRPDGITPPPKPKPVREARANAPGGPSPRHRARCPWVCGKPRPPCRNRRRAPRPPQTPFAIPASLRRSGR
jgi:hypothetical protein